MDLPMINEQEGDNAQDATENELLGRVVEEIHGDQEAMQVRQIENDINLIQQ